MSDPLSHRAKAFCDWLDTVPSSPPFHTRPEFKFYADLSDSELDEAEAEMRRRGDAAESMAAKLSGTAPHG